MVRMSTVESMKESFHRVDHSKENGGTGPIFPILAGSGIGRGSINLLLSGQRKWIIKEHSSSHKGIFIFCKPEACLFIVLALMNNAVVFKGITNEH
jgi:hypothetical protein